MEILVGIVGEVVGKKRMLFSEMLSEIQNDGQEKQFYERMQTELKPLMLKTPKWEYYLPILGKTMKAVNILINSKSIKEFKKTKDYKYVHDFGYSGDLFNGEFNLLPVSGYRKMVANVVLAVVDFFVAEQT